MKNASRSNETVSAGYEYLHSTSQSAGSRRYPPLADFIRRRGLVCSVVKAELYLGAMKSQMPEAKLLNQQKFVERFVSLPFDDAAAAIYGRIRTDLEQAGTPIGPNDLMIASIALANDLILVTHNTREFQRVDGLFIEDWESER